MRNAKALREELGKAFLDLRDGNLLAKDASELANLAGKMINLSKAQIEYRVAQRVDPTFNIEFLEEK